MPVLSMLDAIRDALETEMALDERVMLLGEDIGRNGGVFRATEGLLDRFGADRVVDTPLSEAVIIGASVGLAIAGFVPVPELQFLPFGHQAFHQLSDQVARMRFRSGGRFPMTMTIRAPYGGGVRTPELHSDSIEAKLVQCPGLKVVTPATAHDAKGMLLSAIRDPDPVVFCEPLRSYRLVKDEVPEGAFTVPLGEARIARAGTDVTVIAWGAAVSVALAAADVAAENGVSCHVVDVRSLVPLDVDTIANSVSATGRAVVVHEAPMTAGFGAEIVATVQEEAFYDLQAPIVRVAAPDTPYPFGALEDIYLPSAERVWQGIRRTVEL